MTNNVVRVTLEFEQGNGGSSIVTFDSASCRTVVSGTLYPGDLDLANNVVRSVRARHTRYPQLKGANDESEARSD